MMPPPSLLPIAKEFAVDGKITGIEQFGGGLINDTFLVTTDSKQHHHFILQRINSEVFAQPEWVMENIETLLAHIKTSQDEYDRLTLPEIIKTKTNQLLYSNCKDDHWRALSYIENSESFEKITLASDAEQIGSALGEFHRRVSDMPLAKLHDTLPGFHNTPQYLADYHQIKSSRPETPDLRFCTKNIAKQQYQADILETAKQQSLLAERVIHGDPKLNNLLFSKSKGLVISIIDLDTVKPGLVHYDIGDCLRSCCQTENPLRFDLDICELILSRYLEQVEYFFTAYDYDYLYPAMQLLPFELGLRFFSDYLQGNRYFKVSVPEQNLERACRQFQVMQSIHKQQAKIERLIRKCKKCSPLSH